MKMAVCFPEPAERCAAEHIVPGGPGLHPPQDVACLVASAAGISESLRAAWRDLAADASEPNSFAENWFVEASLGSFDSQGDVRLVQIWSGNEAAPRLLGLLPVCIRDAYGRARVRHVENWDHFHAFLGTPLVRRGHERTFWAAVLEALDGADWAPNFLHIHGLVAGGPVHTGLTAAARGLGRTCPIVHRVTRAMLASHLSPEDYYAQTVRKKKRKELQRLSRRLAEMGHLESRALAPDEPLGPWCDAFLALEQSGWKGRAGSALSSAAPTERFFRGAVEGAAAAGRLQFLRLDLDRQPIAMLVNFLAPPGSFSFKIAFDERYAHFSPGVLIQRDNLELLRRDDIDWMDSCAVEHHPMIESLWAERRTIIRVTIRLRGIRRRLAYTGCRLLETGAARVRALTSRPEALR